MQTKHGSDYLAVITIAGGMGSWARDTDREQAIKRVMRIFRSDFKSLLKIKKGTPIKIDVLDVTGHDKVWWDDRGFYTKSNKPLIGSVEVVERPY